MWSGKTTRISKRKPKPKMRYKVGKYTEINELFEDIDWEREFQSKSIELCYKFQVYKGGIREWVLIEG